MSLPAAEVIGDKTLRSLDAVHLATAHWIRTDLSAFVCYDKRLRDCARPRTARRSPRLTRYTPSHWRRGAPNLMFCACLTCERSRRMHLR